MQHVFVETNWVVSYAAPAHHRDFAATALLKKASDGDVKLYLPSICVAESRRPVQERFQVRLEADRVRRFLLWAKQKGIVDPKTDETVRRVLDQMEGLVKADLELLEDRLKALYEERGLEIFDLNQAMMERCTELCHVGLDLKPFDQMILAAILVKAEELKAGGVTQFAFCEADTDLQPWDKNGNPKERLVKFYDGAAIWVYQDFLLEKPEIRKGWPNP